MKYLQCVTTRSKQHDSVKINSRVRHLTAQSLLLHTCTKVSLGRGQGKRSNTQNAGHEHDWAYLGPNKGKKKTSQFEPAVITLHRKKAVYQLSGAPIKASISVAIIVKFSRAIAPMALPQKQHH